jgi:hypothetical protein
LRAELLGLRAAAALQVLERRGVSLAAELPLGLLPVSALAVLLAAGLLELRPLLAVLPLAAAALTVLEPAVFSAAGLPLLLRFLQRVKTDVS